MLLHGRLIFSYLTVKYSSVGVPNLDSSFIFKHIMSTVIDLSLIFSSLLSQLSCYLFHLNLFSRSLFCHLSVTSLKSWYWNHYLICLFSLLFYVTDCQFSLYYNLLSHFSCIVFGLSLRCHGIIFQHFVFLGMD
jgi:hypothetical protein